MRCSQICEWRDNSFLGLFGSFCGWNPTLVSQDLIDIFFSWSIPHLCCPNLPFLLLEISFCLVQPQLALRKATQISYMCRFKSFFSLRKASNLAASALNPSAPPPSFRAESCLNHLDPAGSRLLKWSISPAKNGPPEGDIVGKVTGDS